MTDQPASLDLDDIAARAAKLNELGLPGGNWTASTCDEKSVFPPEMAHVVEDVLHTGGAKLRSSVGVFGDPAHAEFVAHAREDVPALLDEVRRLRARVAEALRPDTPRLCKCGHSNLAHTVPAPHSCFAFGQTCPCEAYRQLPHDEAVAQLKLNQQAAAERAAAAAPDPICGDANDGDWCELEPGHDGHHRADTVEWAAATPAP